MDQPCKSQTQRRNKAYPRQWNALPSAATPSHHPSNFHQRFKTVSHLVPILSLSMRPSKPRPLTKNIHTITESEPTRWKRRGLGSWLRNRMRKEAIICADLSPDEHRPILEYAKGHFFRLPGLKWAVTSRGRNTDKGGVDGHQKLMHENVREEEGCGWHCFHSE